MGVTPQPRILACGDSGCALFECMIFVLVGLGLERVIRFTTYVSQIAVLSITIRGRYLVYVISGGHSK